MSAPTEGGVPRALKQGAGWLLAVGAAFFGAALVTCSYHLIRGSGAQDDSDEGTVVRPTADVVVAVRDLARLESASYHIERVVDLHDKQTHLFGLLEAQDAILLVAAGDVRAGIDLTEMGDGDVEIEPETRLVRIVLPPPRVFGSRIDNDRTYVHSRATDLLARRNETLESEARREAERTIREAAVEAGILERARHNAGRTVEALVRSLGYREVRLEWREE